MTLQNGVDIIEINRIEKSITNQRFIQRIFSEEEQAYIFKKHTPASTAAGHFAAKEAFVKALGTGITTLDLNHIGITHTTDGAPVFALTGWAAQQLGSNQVTLSISHTDQTAIAFVTIYKGD